MPKLVDPTEDHCTAPGGCASCPDRSYCTGLRIGLGMTEVDQEFSDGHSPTSMNIPEE